MAYTSPSPSIDFSFPGTGYSAPAGSIDFSWVPPLVTGTLAAEVVVSSEVSGTFFELVTGWIEGDIAVTATVEGYAYPIGDILSTISLTPEIFGEQPPYGSIECAVVVASSINGMVALQGLIALKIPVSVAIELTHYQPSVIDLSATFVGAHGVSGVINDPVHIEIDIRGGTGATGSIAAEITAVASMTAGHGAGGESSFVIQPSLLLVGEVLESYSGTIAFEVPVRFDFSGNHVSPALPGADEPSYALYCVARTESVHVTV